MLQIPTICLVELFGISLFWN